MGNRTHTQFEIFTRYIHTEFNFLSAKAFIRNCVRGGEQTVKLRTIETK